MSILSTLGVSISNAFNAVYVEAVDTFSTQYTHMYLVCMLMQLTQSNYNVDSGTKSSKLHENLIKSFELL